MAILARIGNLNTLRAFKIPAYRMYFLGLTGIWASFSMEQVARTYLIYEITGSAAMLGTITLAGTAPILLLSLFGGAVADRFPKKLLIQLSQAMFVFVFLGYAIASNIGYLSPAHPESWWVLLAGGVLMGVSVALTMPARGAIIPEIVDRERLMNAISLNILGMSLFQMAGPFIAGYVIGGFGYPVIFYTISGLNVLAMVFNQFLPKMKPKPSTNKSVFVDISIGFKYVQKNRTIMLVLIFFVTSVLLVNPLQMLMPIFAKDILKVGVEGQGTLMSMMGIGSIIVSLLLASLPSRRRGFILLLSNIIMGTSLVIFAFSTSWLLSLGMMLLIGVGRIGTDACGNALIQSYTDSGVLGRVNSIVMLSFGMGGLGTFVIGILAETISAPFALGGPAILLILSSIAAMIFLPRLKNLD